MNGTGVIKTTINIDEEMLTRMKRTAQNLYSDARSLSELMGDATESFDAESILEAFMEKMGWEKTDYPSLREIEESRPTSTADSTSIIREMGDNRANRTS